MIYEITQKIESKAGAFGYRCSDIIIIMISSFLKVYKIALH